MVTTTVVASKTEDMGLGPRASVRRIGGRLGDWPPVEFFGTTFGMRWIAVVLVAACGSTAKPAPVPPAKAQAGVPAAHYAALFRKDAAWTYAVTTTSEAYDPEDPKANHDGQVVETSTAQVHCQVAEVRAWAQGVMSRVDCDAPLAPTDPLAGAWVADARGLWRPDELPEAGAAPDLADARLVIAAAPKPGKEEKKGTGDEEGFGESTEIVQKDGAWCVTYASWGGDEAYDTLCFAAAGVVRGAAGWSGGSTHDTRFELVR